MELKEMLQVATDIGVRFGIRIIGAIALWIVGRALIGYCGRLISRGLLRRRVDPTLGLYIASAVSIGLNVVLIIAILGLFGVETTTFAALVAAAGVAIGVAWGGLLGNFAAGVFLVIFRPFKSGDFVSSGGVVGTVQEIGMFATTINSPDNVRTIVGNNKIVSDTILNYSANPYRRVDLTAQLAHGVDVNEAVGMLRARLVRLPHVLAQPAPDVEILQFNLARPGRSWPCGRIATTRTTGRCISTPTGSFVRRSVRLDTRCPSSTCGCRAQRADLLLTQVRLADARVPAEVHRRALRHDAPLLENVGARGDGEGLHDVLPDQAHAHAVGVDARDHLEHLIDDVRRQAERRLVEEQEPPH